MSSSLQGAYILVTRPVAQIENLCGLIEDSGGKAIRFPTLEIVEAKPEPSVLQAAAASDWLIFTSANAVNFAIKAFGGKMPALSKPQIAAVGSATANALILAGWRVDCVPSTEFNSEGLLAELMHREIGGKVCVVVRGVGGREKLAETLHKFGARPMYMEVYRRIRPNTDRTELARHMAARQLDATIITSVEALDNLLAMLNGEWTDLLKQQLLVVASDRIGQTARQLGFTRIAVSRQPTDAAILEILTTLLNGENSGRRN